MSPILLVLGCIEDESGTAFPAADVVRFSGGAVTAGEHDPLLASDRYEGGDEDGYDWSLATAGGTLLLGVPAASEVRQFLGGKLAGGGGLFSAGELGERFGAAVAARGQVVLVGVPEHDGGPELDGAGGVTFLDGTVLVGASAQVGFGEALAICDDIDGSSVIDWVASAPFESDLGGAVYRGDTLSGEGAEALANSVAELERLPGAAGEGYGKALSCGEHLVDSAAADVVVGVPFSAGSDGADAAGRVELWSQTAFESGEPSRTLYGEAVGANPDERFGSALAVCELDGDGLFDLVVGAPGADEGTGRVYVFPGGTLGSDQAMGNVFPPTRTLFGTSEGGHFGDAIDCGDLSADGVDELFVGAPGEDAEDGTREIGALYAFLGPASGWGTSATTDAAFASFRSDRAFLRVGDRFIVDDLDGDTLADVMMVIRQRARGE